eukprot:TRINITY_DN247_c0_g2_i6.p1 TRINITY_DN247_c0_g2~~TRINITY_DN247_c0_g2_i6.p1  ORF type:complete len:136 (-),score=17.75 TRINITY_DN247_c0_g2_i6:309-716(-)
MKLSNNFSRFLTDLYKEEGKKDVEKIVPNIPLFIPEVPQQSNGNDCGIFLLHFIDMFLQSASELDISDGNYPCFLAENWFESSDIEQRRKHIYDLLLNDNNCANQIISRRVSTRIKKLSGFVSIQQKSNLIDLSL